MTTHAVYRVPPERQRIIAGWNDVRAALQSTALASDPYSAGFSTRPSDNLLTMDGERHRSLRRVLAAYLSPARLQTLRAPVEAVCTRFLQRVAAGERPEIVSGLCEPLVTESLLCLLEIPDRHREEVMRRTRALTGILDPDAPEDVLASAGRAAVQLTLVFEREARSGVPTGLHAALERGAEEGSFPRRLARSTPVVVLHGGYENPLNQLGCIAAVAVENPRFTELARQDPVHLFNEVLRLHSPARRVVRWAAGAGGPASTPADHADLVWIDLESANLESPFAGAADGDQTGGSRRHVGFGLGRHACPGSTMARMQGVMLIDTLARLDPDLLAAARIEWHEGPITRGVGSIAWH